MQFFRLIRWHGWNIGKFPVIKLPTSVSERKSCGIFVWMHFGYFLLFFSLFGATIGIVKIHRASWWVFLVEGRWYPFESTNPGPRNAISSRISHWHCRWCRRKSQCTAATTLRWNDPHFDLCRGSYGFERKVLVVLDEILELGDRICWYVICFFEISADVVCKSVGRRDSRLTGFWLMLNIFACPFQRQAWRFEVGHRIVSNWSWYQMLNHTIFG